MNIEILKIKAKVKGETKSFSIKMGILFRLQSFWVGFHYSKYNKRLCINPIPCVTIWIGNAPNLKLM